MDKIGPLPRRPGLRAVLDAIHGRRARPHRDATRPLGAAQAARRSAHRRSSKGVRAVQGREKKVYEQALADWEGRRQDEAVDRPTKTAAAALLLWRSGGLRRHTRDGRVAESKPGEERLAETFRASRLIPAVEYIRAQRARSCYPEAGAVLRRLDVIVTALRPAHHHQLTGHPQVVVLAASWTACRRLSFIGTSTTKARRYAWPCLRAGTEWHTKHRNLLRAGGRLGCLPGQAALQAAAALGSLDVMMNACLIGDQKLLSRTSTTHAPRGSPVQARTETSWVDKHNPGQLIRAAGPSPT